MEDTLIKGGYILLFFYSIGGGMVAIIAAGILSFSGHFNIHVSIAIALIANFLGDTMLYYLSKYNRQMVYPYIRKHRRKLALSHILMKKYGDKIIIIKKYIYGLKTLVPIAIGLTSYSFVKFTILNFLGALIWAVTLGYGSYFAGDFMMRAVNYISENYWIMPIVMLTLLGSIWYYFSYATKKKV
ncbi:MAG: DedA family protein [Campylobacteraceae bacterium]